MNHIYVSTDAKEAKKIIDPIERKGYNYHHIDINHGTEIARRIGFNPMSSIEFDESTSLKLVKREATELVNKGFIVAVESNGKIEKYKPKDIDSRDKLVKLAMQKETMTRHNVYRGFALLLYSSNPHEINDFWEYWE